MSAPLHTWRNRSPGDLSVELPEVTATPVEAVIEAAAAAAQRWARAPMDERIERLRGAQRMLLDRTEELARGIAVETGKPIREARGELAAVIAKFDLTISDAREYLSPRTITDGPHPALVRRIARGPAAIIAPFNFPLHLANGALLAHLLAGNPVIFKPSPLAAVVAGQYAEFMQQSFPPGVFNLVQGDAQEARSVCLDPRVRAVCFTGSVPAGRALAEALAADFSKELALELGGRNPVIVCADADLALAADAAAEGACLTCGQRCNATSRVLVEATVAGEFEERLRLALSGFEPGDPLRETTKLGPLINAAAVQRYARLLAEPGEWLVAGEILEQVAGKRGHYVRPAVRRGGGADDSESFVPVIDLEVVPNLEAAIGRANALPFGLSASVFTRSEARFWEIAGEVRAGNIYANLPTTFSPATLPFGGAGDSGNGRPGGRGFIRFTTEEQAVQLASGSFAPPPEKDG